MRRTSTRATTDSYLQLIKAFPLRRLKTPQEHRAAMKIYLDLAGGAAASDAGTGPYLEVLVDLIADFERRAGWAINARGVTAAELVRHLLAERGQSVNALAKQIGFPQSNLSEMLAGKRAWSKTAILALTDVFPIDPRRFLKDARVA